MTEVLTTAAVVLCGLLALSFAPPFTRRLPCAPRSIQRYLLKGLIGVLIGFSLYETICETGLIYGVIFSLIPVVAGAVVLRNFGRQTSAS